MKQNLFKSVATVAMSILALACTKEQVTVNSQSESVSFTIEAPGAPATKAIGDGTTAKQLYYQVFDNNGNVIAGLGCQKTSLSNKKAEVNFQLVKDQTYNFIFWAQTTEEGYYTIDGTEGLKKITANYTGKSANDEKFDAFFAIKTMTITGPVNENITLKRPFAQINIATSDKIKAGDASVDVNFEGAKSEVKVKQVPSVFAPLATEQLTTPVDVTFALAAAPGDDLAITGKTETYKRLSVNYIFAPEAGTVYDLQAKLQVDGKDVSLNVPSTPAKRNWRTNIYGNLLTTTADFHVEAHPDFDGTKEEEVVTVSSVAAANEAFAAGETNVNITAVEEGATTINLPKTTSNVGLSLPDTDKSLTVTYADDASDSEQPQTVNINAKNAAALTINAPSTHVELNGITATNVTATTSDNTLVVGKESKISTLTIEKGSAVIYGSVTTLIKGKNAADAKIEWHVYDAKTALAAVANSDKVILEENLTFNSDTFVIKDGKRITLDLNGHNIYAPMKVLTIYNAHVDIIGEGEISETQDDGYGAIILKGSNEDVADYTVINIGKDVTLKGWAGIFLSKDVKDEFKNYGIVVNCSAKFLRKEGFEKDCSGLYINGSNKVTTGNVARFNLDGCKMDVRSNGIYAAGYAKWSLKNCEIKALNSAMEIRAGEATFDGGTYVATENPANVTPNGNGSTIEGAAIGISQHNTNLPLVVTVNSGSFMGVYSVLEKDAQDENARDLIKVYINGGSFDGDVYSQNNKGFIKGGTFSHKFPKEYLESGLRLAKDGENWVVKNSSEADVATPESAQSIIDNAEQGVVIELVSGNYGVLYLRQTPDNSTARKDLDKDASYPAYYRSFKGVTIKAKEGANVVCDGIKAEAGLFWITSAPASNHAEMKEMSGKNGFISYLSLENVTIDGIKFSDGKAAVIIRDNRASEERSTLLVDGLTIQNCSGKGDLNNSNLHFFSAGTGSNDQKFPGTEKYALNNIVIKNNVMTDYYQPICHNNNSVIVTNYSIVGNTFKDCMDNQIQMSNKVANGTWTISNNKFDGINGRVIRMTSAQASSVITFKDNKLANVRGYDTGGDGDIVKITGVNGFTVNESGNDWLDGEKTNETTWKSMGDTSKL